uniref:Amino acid permease/ SLC12A domain-containing protein n=1 Tax=Hyaloperonospora arabidopsidis (strain Emoy2) TaxID=559515 RepID=M4C382_HYAAE
MVSSVSDEGDHSLQVPSSSYMEFLSPRLPSSGARSRAVNMRRRKLEIEIVEGARMGPTWQFPGAGSSEYVQVPPSELHAIQEELNEPKKLLGELPATAISGNDILSSVLYSASSVAAKSGKLMPIPLLIVSIVLYFFRFIYEEVVTAIPMNGGTYNALLNTTSKRSAAVAACLSILSYVATGVVSATSGIRYLNNQVTIPIIGSTIILLGAFALLAVMGITESSRVAVAIFLHHIVVLLILFVACIIYWFNHSHIFSNNLHAGYPEVDFAGSMLDGNIVTAIFFGFGASMLGITGFESSSNYVEEQAPGVFRKTLRNMWALVTFFNVGLSTAILAVLPLEGDNGIYNNSSDLLAMVSREAVGSWFETWISIDAFIVLSGAVLTSYVGICGLVRRLSTDRVLPAFLATTNKARGTNHYIIGIYFLLSSSLVLILNADASTMNGVYTYSFLGLMAMFSCACMLLKGKRSEIPRDIHAPWTSVIVGFLLVVVAIFANLLGDPKILMYFAIYFIVVIFVMFIMFERVTILRFALMMLKTIFPSHYGKAVAVGLATGNTDEWEHTGARGGRTIARTISSIRNAPIIFFCKVPDLTIINKAIIYVRRNEQTHTLRIVHVFEGEEGDACVVAAFREMVALFDSMYPKIRVDFVAVCGEFGPAMIEWLSRSMKVPRNMMFITQPDLISAERVSAAGMRVITA